MKLLQLAWKNISGNGLRSWVVALCALVVAAFALFATLLLRGAATSLELAADRLGADIVVVPEGAQTEMEGALLMGVPAQFWMPEENVEKLAAIPGVEVVSPQVYLATLVGASCCSVSQMFMIAYDPETDFTVRPWLEEQLSAGLGLGLGEVIGGDYIFATEKDDGILVYGDLVKLKGNLEPTGTGLDQSLFFTLDTAHDIARISETQAEEPLVIPPDQVSAILVKTKPGADNEKIAVDIYRNIPGVFPIESANLFQSSRAQLTSLLNTVVIVMALIWPLAILLIGMIYLMAANERRRELGVLRALGATRRFVAKSLLTEASLLALCGASVGAFLAVLAIYLFRRLIVSSLGVPFLLPSPGSLALEIGIGLLLAMLSVVLAALLPALKISRQDPAIAMRE
jgi:putative ABC transport system permease protein